MPVITRRSSIASAADTANPGQQPQTPSTPHRQLSGRMSRRASLSAAVAAAERQAVQDATAWRALTNEPVRQWHKSYVVVANNGLASPIIVGGGNSITADNNTIAAGDLGGYAGETNAGANIRATGAQSGGGSGVGITRSIGSSAAHGVLGGSSSVRGPLNRASGVGIIHGGAATGAACQHSRVSFGGNHYFPATSGEDVPRPPPLMMPRDASYLSDRSYEILAMARSGKYYSAPKGVVIPAAAMPAHNTGPYNQAVHTTGALNEAHNVSSCYGVGGGSGAGVYNSGADGPLLGSASYANIGRHTSDYLGRDYDFGPVTENDMHFRQDRLYRNDTGPQPFTVRAWRKIPVEGESDDECSALSGMSMLARRNAMFASANLQVAGEPNNTDNTITTGGSPHASASADDDDDYGEVEGGEEANVHFRGHHRRTSSLGSMSTPLFQDATAQGRRRHRRTTSGASPSHSTHSRHGSSTSTGGSGSGSAVPLTPSGKPYSMTRAAISMRRKRARERLAKAEALEPAQREAGSGGTGSQGSMAFVGGAQEGGTGVVGGMDGSAGAETEVADTPMTKAGSAAAEEEEDSDGNDDDPNDGDYHSGGGGDEGSEEADDDEDDDVDEDEEEDDDGGFEDRASDDDFVKSASSRSSRKRAGLKVAAGSRKRAASGARRRRSRAA